ncbi:uncharacterized protein AAGF69_003646 isoform 2-T3 [Amazona ochrocephala]
MTPGNRTADWDSTLRTCFVQMLLSSPGTLVIAPSAVKPATFPCSSKGGTVSNAFRKEDTFLTSPFAEEIIAECLTQRLMISAEMQEVKRDADHLNYTTKYSAGKTQHGSVTRRGRNSSGASDQALHATSPSCILQWLRYN